VIHVLGFESLEVALRKADFVDALLLDSGNPNLPVRELGGTGRVHNWEVSAKIVEQSKVPVYLAGGLNQGNVRAAIDRVRPFGLDLCSGVRTNGRLDPAKIESFFSTLINDFQ
jgi:phosphoribosylanthranilate isomerase